MKTFMTALTAIALFSTVAQAEVKLEPKSYANFNFGNTVLSDDGYNNDSTYSLNYGRYLDDGYRWELGLDRTNVETNSLDGDVTSVIQGIYKDFNNETDFTPFVGFNLGYGVADGNALGNDDNGLLYGFTGGSSYSLNEDVDVVGQYRYLRSDWIDYSDNSDYDSHGLTVGARIKF